MLAPIIDVDPSVLIPFIGTNLARLIYMRDEKSKGV